MITDGVFALPDAITVDSLLAQLRASTVCCSFIKVGSGFHAHCRLILNLKSYTSVDFVVVCLDSVCFTNDSQFFVTVTVLLTKLYTIKFNSSATNFIFFPSSLGYVPHCDMMQFIAMASSGAYLAKAPPVSRRHCALLISMEDDTLNY